MEKILVVVDMQNDFISGILGTAEAEGIVGNVVDKIKIYEGSKIYLTRDTHFDDYMKTQEGERLPMPHCIKGTWGWEIHPDVIGAVEAATKDYKIIDKPTFGSLSLAEEIYQDSLAGDIEIELVGLCTDICVVSNAMILKAKVPEVKISVDAKCMSGVTVASHSAALKTMEMCQIEVNR